MMKKIRQGFLNGIFVSISGIVLALNAQSIAFMGVKNYSPPRSDTSYAVQEHILQQIGLLLLAFGLLLILMSYWEYLRTPTGDN